jgi:REP element-mobilizing transposase RayT
VTLCTLGRECLFGKIEKGETRLSEIGSIVGLFWEEIPRHFQKVALDSWVIMPNHLHGILSLRSVHPAPRGGAQHTVRSTHQVVPGSLGAIVRSFKAVAARRVNEIRRTPGWTIWQRNYYEHIIRTPAELLCIQKYIRENPARWALDRENPQTPPRIESPRDWWDS